ncbi:hypothetical protein HYU09_02940 [Candidatus Woesearchaeota archaeon]|nr:hypothetical protein [Candidatus Woesearchaeota archaeon]
MKLLKSRKSEAITVILVTLIIIVFLGWLINVGSRECRSNSQCGSAQYCGSDFACHELPTIEKTIVKNNLIVPSMIVGIAIIIAAAIIRFGKSPLRKNSNAEIPAEQKNHLRMP